MRTIGFWLFCLCCLTGCQKLSSSSSLGERPIKLGSVLALEGQEEGLGNRMKHGLEAALSKQTVQGRPIKLLFKNDYYEPETTKQKTKELLQDNILMMIGNVGTPTAKVSLPILAEQNIPAVGFFTGAQLLRPGTGAIVNFRASYAQEIAAVVKLAQANDLKAEQICAYVQNDSYGKAGLMGIQQALPILESNPTVTQAYDEILSMQDEQQNRNGIGPVGVYTRNTPNIQEGYDSLKSWEQKTGYRCRLIITAGSYSNIARFAYYAKQQQENWIISAVSFTGGDDFLIDLAEYGVKDNIIMTHVVPLLDSDLPIIQEAREQLDDDFGHVSLEGYVVGKMTLKILNEISGEITPESFMAQVRESKFNLGGVDINFHDNHNQGSDYVIVSYLTADGFRPIDNLKFSQMLK